MYVCRAEVWGYECRRVIPAGVGSGSPSRYMQSAYCLRDSADRLRRDGDMVGRGWCSPGAHLSRGSNLIPFGRRRHARDKEHCRRDPGSAFLGGYAPESSRFEGSSIVDEPGKC